MGAMPGTIRRHMQFAEFERLPDHPGKRELLRGALIELPPAKQKHNQIAERIYLRLREILPGASDSNKKYLQPTDPKPLNLDLSDFAPHFF